MRVYVLYREMGHRSVFGENSLMDLSTVQSKLLSLTHLYDVIRSFPDIEDSIPDNVLPYPLALNEWYIDWKEKQKEERNKTQKSQKPNKASKDVKNALDDVSDVQSLALRAVGRANPGKDR